MPEEEQPRVRECIERAERVGAKTGLWQGIDTPCPACGGSRRMPPEMRCRYCDNGLFRDRPPATLSITDEVTRLEKILLDHDGDLARQASETDQHITRINAESEVSE
jgi:DnaJ-class molecular chaperone